MSDVLPFRRTGQGDTTLVLLHFFGSSGRAWGVVTPLLDAKFDCVAADMPGFGDAADRVDYAVADMADAVRRTVESLGAKRVVLVGHSMSAKVSAVVAAQGLANLAGLVLVTPSPPGPEPMTDAGRAKMLAYGRNRADAEQYLDGVTAEPLLGETRETAIEDFVRCNSAAWAAWLESGSREDWSARVGRLILPTLLVTGKDDPSLGLGAQKSTTLPHLTSPQIEDVSHCGHVPMLETPGRLAGVIARFAERI